MKPLHIAASLRIVSKHLHVRKVAIAAARDAIQRAAKMPELHQAMVAELEQVTGMRVAELAELTKKWLPNDGPDAPQEPAAAPRRKRAAR